MRGIALPIQLHSVMIAVLQLDLGQPAGARVGVKLI